MEYKTKILLNAKELKDFLKEIPDDAEVFVNCEEVWNACAGAMVVYNPNRNILLIDTNLREVPSE